MTAEHRKRLAAYAKKLIGTTGAVTPASHVESLSAGPRARLAVSDRAEEILEQVRDDRPLTEEAAAHLEAIILPGLRPVFDVRGGTFEDLPGPWDRMNSGEGRKRLEKAIRAIGRLDILGHPRLAYGGTGFLVGKNLLLTNRHVAGLFTNGVGVRNLAFTFASRVDLKQELESEATLFLTVTGARMIHPHWDAALLTVTGVPEDVAPLTLASEATVGRQMVAVVGYPAMDPHNDLGEQRRMFRNVFEKKRLQPGFVTGMGQLRSFGHLVEAELHDASTLGGNSGSAVIDVESGLVVGLHFAGEYLETNYAVPAWELALDQQVVDLGVQFAGRKSPPPAKPPSWLSAWRVLDEPVTLPQQPAVKEVDMNAGDECTWTIPIQVTIRVGTPVRTVAAGPVAVQPGPKAVAADPLEELRRARRSYAENPGSYYPESVDRAAAMAYYSGISANSSGFVSELSELLSDTHTHKLPYKPTVHLYPVVDLHADGDLVSIYSEQAMNPESVIRAEAPMEAALEAMEAAGATEEAVASLEAIGINSAEHVVPQSWFKAKQPMKGDLHHLFACERDCNSFRGNTPYWQFGPEERVMEDCGRLEKPEDKFEPKGGKGAVARATFYFLMRYPSEVAYEAERVTMLRRWHRENPVSTYERHRNREIFLKQGNRNPFIDHPEWVDLIEF